MKIASVLLVVLLCSCGDDRPPEPTPEETDQLNAADAALNEAAEDDGR